jgi:hypothetical protein
MLTEPVVWDDRATADVKSDFVPTRELIYWYRVGWEHRLQDLDKTAEVLSHRLKFLRPGHSHTVLPEAIELNSGPVGKLRSTAMEGLEWLTANPSPRAEVNAAFRAAWYSYIDAADALIEIGASSGILTPQESGDRAYDAWVRADREANGAWHTFSEAVTSVRH